MKHTAEEIERTVSQNRRDHIANDDTDGDIFFQGTDRAEVKSCAEQNEQYRRGNFCPTCNGIVERFEGIAKGDDRITVCILREDRAKDQTEDTDGNSTDQRIFGDLDQQFFQVDLLVRILRIEDGKADYGEDIVQNDADRYEHRSGTFCLEPSEQTRHRNPDHGAVRAEECLRKNTSFAVIVRDDRGDDQAEDKHKDDETATEQHLWNWQILNAFDVVDVVKKRDGKTISENEFIEFAGKLTIHDACPLKDITEHGEECNGNDCIECVKKDG